MDVSVITLPAGFTRGQLLLILLIVLFSAFMLVSVRRKIRRSQGSPKAYAREQVARLREEQTVIGDMEQVMQQLEQLAGLIQARIDTRFAKLEKVIRDADNRIDRLERLLRRADGQPTLDLTAGDEPIEEPARSAPHADQRKSAVYRLADAGESTIRIAEQTDLALGEVELMLALRKRTAAV